MWRLVAQALMLGWTLPSKSPCHGVMKPARSFPSRLSHLLDQCFPHPVPSGQALRWASNPTLVSKTGGFKPPADTVLIRASRGSLRVTSGQSTSKWASKICPTLPDQEAATCWCEPASTVSTLGPRPRWSTVMLHSPSRPRVLCRRSTSGSTSSRCGVKTARTPWTRP